MSTQIKGQLCSEWPQATHPAKKKRLNLKHTKTYEVFLIKTTEKRQRQSTSLTALLVKLCENLCYKITYDCSTFLEI